MLTFLLLSVISFLLCFCWIILYGRRNSGKLENSGFPVIPPTLFLGSDPFFYKDVAQLKDLERRKEFGPIWGLYMGATPQILISDPELIRLIFVKDKDYFKDRKDVDFGCTLLNEVLDYLPGEKWKTVRSFLSPLFTTSKLKSMGIVMTTTAMEYVTDLNRECGHEGRVKYDCKIRLTSFLIDLFVQSTLGVQFQNRKDPDNKFALAFRQMMGEEMNYGFLHSLTLSFPWLTIFAPTFGDSPTKLIELTFRHILNSRRCQSSGKDFLEVFTDLMAKVDSEEFQRLKITEMTVISQAVNLVLGGYETSLTTLSHLLYFMATLPEIQDRLYAELESKFRSGSVIPDHENIKEENTPYLTACLNEALRLAPPLQAERLCTKDWTHEGVRIKKGTQVYIAMFPAQRNPDIFPNPDEFIPERFLTENKAKIDTYSFVVFGHGSRNCMGMRFAYDSIKIFLINFLLQFRLELRPDTVLKYRPGSSLLLTFDPLYLDVVRRH